MLLVTGATGNVGSALLPKLLDAGAEVRALVHTAASGEVIQRLGVEAVDGDFDEPGTLETAMEGCDRLFLLSPPHPDQAEREKAAVDAAKQSGVRHVTALSVMGADRRSTGSLARWHGEIDDHLVTSGLDYTILRPMGYMQVHLLPMDTVRANGHWYGMAGDGAAAFIDSGDVAAVAAAVLTSGGHEGHIYDITGPATITMPQAAAQLAEALGTEVSYVDLPADSFHGSLVTAGLPGWLANALVELYGVIREGHAATVSNSVEALTGRPPHSYSQLLEKLNLSN